MIRAQLLTNHQGSAVVSAKNAEGRVHVRILPMGYEAFLMAVEQYKRGALIQQAFKELDSCDREFLKTGMTPINWYDLYRGNAEPDDLQDMLRDATAEGPHFLTPDQFELVYSGEKSPDEVYAYNRKQIETRVEARSEDLCVA